MADDWRRCTRFCFFVLDYLLRGRLCLGLLLRLELVRVAPLPALLINYGLGIGIIVLANVITRQPWPSFDKLSGVPWWAWVTGGFLGAYYVSAALFLAPRLGATMLVMTIVTGQILVSVLLDHKGWLGYSEHPINLGRLAGITCMVVGLFLIRRF